MRARKGRVAHLLLPERVAQQWRVRRGTGTALDRWPRCAACGTPVEYIGVEHKGSKSWDLKAKCHGEVEVQTISWEHWSDSEPERDVLQKHISAMVFFRPEHWESAT